MVESVIRQKWRESKIYESSPDSREKIFVTAAFPYPNSPQHIGHARTYTIADINARYWRMRGYNVLFPMGFHVTGTPILAMAKRLEEGDEELYEIFENIYGISRETAKKLTDPRELVLYFSRNIEEGMKLLGLAIDWRRKFYTFDPHFNKFIQWQFKKLKDHGLLIKGSHPIPWSVKLNSAVGAHDTKGDIDPEIEEMVAIKFETQLGFVLTATLRPETIWGVTNLWINPKAEYIIVEHKGEKWIMAKEAYEKLKYQMDLTAVEDISAEKLLKLTAKNPITEEEIPIYPAIFVEPADGTGAVMSVPAHAPYDYIALKELGKLHEKIIITRKGKPSLAREVVEQEGIKTQQDQRLKDLTKEFYRLELKEGFHKPLAVPVKEAREKAKEMLLAKNHAVIIYKIANGPVYTRVGDEVIVKVVKDQWFINYGDAEWKKTALEWTKQMKIWPEEAKKQLLAAIEWVDKKACTRSKGLGTKFPFDESQMIEALSDSTIYPAFYTIAHLIKKRDPTELDEAFFDYIFLGIGQPRDEEHQRMREEFLYYYPVDFRHTGADLIRNHLIFYIMNHIAIFPKELWPRSIVVNGFVLMEGKKMSKSLGNILPLTKAIEKYGADVIRLTVVGGAELLQDTDFSDATARGVKERLEFFKKLSQKPDSQPEPIDSWLQALINKKLSGLVEKYESFKYREIVLELFYNMYNDLRWYLRRRRNGVRLSWFFDLWIRALAPIIPYTAEEIWQRKHGESIFLHRIPEAKSWDENILKAEEQLKQLVEDLRFVLSRKPAKVVKIGLAADWKYEMYLLVSKTEKSKVMTLLKQRFPDKMAEIGKIVKKLKNKFFTLQPVVDKEFFKKYLEEAKEFLEQEFNVKVIITEESELGKEALPDKPAIVIE